MFPDLQAVRVPGQRDPRSVHRKEYWLINRATSPFPFSRVANTTVENSSNIYFYHQINDIVIAEDMYNTNASFFASTSFEI